jgi:hypothetical protein
MCCIYLSIIPHLFPVKDSCHNRFRCSRTAASGGGGGKGNGASFGGGGGGGEGDGSEDRSSDLDASLQAAGKSMSDLPAGKHSRGLYLLLLK